MAIYPQRSIYSTMFIITIILNYVYHNYNDKTGFYKNRIGSSSGEHEQQNMNRWKCEKCSNHFARFKQLKQHKGEYHAY
jgi:hypothetical protein